MEWIEYPAAIRATRWGDRFGTIAGLHRARGAQAAIRGNEVAGGTNAVEAPVIPEDAKPDGGRVSGGEAGGLDRHGDPLRRANER